MNKRFQLIKPVISDNIHEATSLLKGAKKCYNELKLSHATNYDEFSIYDIDSKQIHRFKIHCNNNNALQPTIPKENEDNVTHKQIDNVIEKIDNIGNRMCNIEIILNNMNNKISTHIINL